MNTHPSIFKAYDIRGIYPSQIDGEGVYAIAQAYAKFLKKITPGGGKALTVAVGRDMRLCGEEFAKAAISGLTDAGADVLDIGLVSTDMLYFAAATQPVHGGIQITASHNPKEYGGLKLVKAKAAPISGDSGIYEIRDMVAGGTWRENTGREGLVIKADIKPDYFSHVLSKFDVSKFRNLKVVANTNFGMAGPALEEIKKRLPALEFLKVINGELNGEFPKGRPDPLVPENRGETIEAVKELKPDLGVAWDADADRCFFFDENGRFVTPAYINAVLSEYYLHKYPGAKIIHDTRVVRVIDFVAQRTGGVAIAAKAGHSFIKERMLKEQAAFGSETSGHYYFKENFYLDNGLIPFLAVLDILSRESDLTFSQLLKPLREKFFISEEINFKVSEPEVVIDKLKQKYKDAEPDEIDGQSYNYKDWRFNVRKSNTENLLRVNLEADSQQLLETKTKEVKDFIAGLSSRT